MSKYGPLSARLSGHDTPEWRANFAELEEVLGFPLPKSAREQRAWWGNERDPKRHPHKRAWLDHGWEVADVDQSAGHVTFRRTAPLGAAAQPAEPPPAKAPVALGDEPAIVAALERPKWHMALVAGGLAVLAGGAALAIGGLMRRRGEKD